MTTAPDGSTRVVVEVNEVKVFATGQGAQWWTWFLRGQPEERFEYARVSIAGAIVYVACDDREHAADLAATMIDHGRLPRTAVTVRVVPGVNPVPDPL